MAQSATTYDSATRNAPWLEEIIGLYNYRDLIVQLISRNIKTRYKRSSLGILWTLLNPLSMLAVLVMIFSPLFEVDTEYYAVYALSGLLCWQFFSQTTSAAMSELIWGGSILNRIYVPRTVFATAALGAGLINMLLGLIPLVALMWLTGVPVTRWILIFPAPVFLMAIFALGVGLMLSTLSTYFADVLDMYQIILTTWMYLTPIVYPKTIIPVRYVWLFNLNPMYHLMEFFRTPFYVGWLAGPNTVMASVVAAFVALFIGWVSFTRRVDDLPWRV